MGAAEEVIAVPELLDRIASFLSVLDIIRMVRVNSYCYRNVRSSTFIKRRLYYLPPDIEPEEGEQDTTESETSQTDHTPATGALNQLGGRLLRRAAAAAQHQIRRHPPDHPPWDYALDLARLNPVLEYILPGSSVINLTNNMAVLTTGTSVRPTKLSGLPKKVRPTWKAMLFTSQICSRIHITPAALYSSSTEPRPADAGFRDFSSITGDYTEPPPTVSRSFSDSAWTPRGWQMDHHCHKKLMLGLEAIGETAPPGWLPGHVSQEHWTEYLARRRNELCDGWVWGQSLEEFGIGGPGAMRKGPKYGYFEETIEAEDGLIRCGQLAREIEAAGWCWWILRLEP